MEDDQIDVVIAWVDGEDPGWQLAYNNALMVSDLKKSFVTNKNRFKDWGTLKYVIRMIKTHLAWVRRIHLVTNGQVPHWLDLSNDYVRLVKHEQIFENANCLPTFNSTAIELNFQNIPGLAEKFIIWNDDFYIFKDVPKEYFFQDGMVVDSLRLRFKVPNFLSALRKSPSSSLIMVDNGHYVALELLKRNRHYGLYFFWNVLLHFFQIRIWHHPQAHILFDYKNVNQNFSNWKNEIESSRFRSDDRYNQYANRFYQLLKGNYLKRKSGAVGLSIFVSKESDLDFLDAWIKGDNNTFFCLCEHSSISDSSFEHLKFVMHGCLKKLYSKKFYWELDDEI